MSTDSLSQSISSQSSVSHWGPIARALMQSKFGSLLIILQVALTLAIVANMAPIVLKKVQDAQRPSGVVDAELVAVSSMSAANMEIAANEDLAPRAAREYQVTKSLPDVQEAALMNSFPNSQSGWSSTIYAKVDVPGPNVVRYFSDDKVLATLGAKIIAGRNFLPEEIVSYVDTSEEPARQLIITESLAKELYGEESAIGKRVSLQADAQTLDSEIIGVVSDVARPWTGWGEYYLAVFEPGRRVGFNRWIVRTKPGADAAKVGQDVMAALAKADRGVIYGTDIRTFTEARKAIYADDLLTAGLLSIFALLVCLITAFGMIGLTSFWITQRTRQIGIRRSLGATQGDIKSYFRQENLLLTAIGVVLGVGLSYLLNFVLARELGAKVLPLSWVLGGSVGLMVMGQLAVTHLASKASKITPALATRTL
jgi:putative ABC transport system permease protein